MRAAFLQPRSSCVGTIEKNVIEEMVDLGKKPRVVVHKDEKDEGDHKCAVKNDDSLPPAGLDTRRKEPGDEEPHQHPEKYEVPYEEPEGHEVEHCLKDSSPQKKLFTSE